MPNNQELNVSNLPNIQEDGGGLSSFVPQSLDSIDNAPGVYGALKCYFFTPKRGDIWGAFCFVFNGTTGESMENVFWVTRALAGPAIDVHTHWRTLNKVIPQMGTFEKSLGDKLSSLMLESFSSSARIELCQAGNTDERLQPISDEIRNSFERATHCFLEFKMSFERMSKQDLTNAGVISHEEAQAAPEADNAQSEEKSFAGTIITCLPVIDPVNGKPVSELEPGDMVEVKIQGGIGASDLIYKYLASTNQDAIFPVETVEKTDSDKTHIFLKINEEVMGIVTVTKDIRLRTLNMGGQKKTRITINMDNLIFMGILMAAMVVIAFVIRFLLS